MKRRNIFSKINKSFIVFRINSKSKKGFKIRISRKPSKNLNSIPHAKLAKGFETGKVFKNKKKIIIKNKVSLDYLYNYDKRD